MQDGIEKSDLRVVKTSRILNAAMFSLLDRYTFKKITVRDICDEAQINRATFYARFTDKYDFLKSWLINLKPNGLEKDSTYEEMERIHNENFNRNKSVIKNLFSDADCETLKILAEFAFTYFMLTDKYDINRMTAEQVVLSNFFAGGMIFYTIWHVKNKFPADIFPMNTYIYGLLKMFQEWDIEPL